MDVRIDPGAAPLRPLPGIARVLVWLAVGTLLSVGPEAAAVPSAELGVIRCSASASPPLVRIEGTQELVGDILLTCHNSGPAVGFEPRGHVDVDISVSMNVGVANRPVSGLGPGFADAVLVVNEKNCRVTGTQRAFGTCGAGGTTVQDPMPAGLDSRQPRTLRWAGVALPIPGAAIGSDGVDAEPVPDCTGRYGLPGGCHPLTTTLRITSIRVDATQLAASQVTGLAAATIEASLEIRADDAAVVLVNSPIPVARAARGIETAARLLDANGFCSEGEATLEVSLSEGFASAFKRAAGPSFYPSTHGWEDGFYPIFLAGSSQRVRVDPTRLVLKVSNLPEDLTVAVPTNVVCSDPDRRHTLALGLVSGASPEGAGGRIGLWRGGFRDVPQVDRGTVTAVYEVSQAQAVVREECRIPVRLSPTEDGNGQVDSVELTVSASLAPLRPAGTPVPGAAQARFIAPSSEPSPSFRLNACGTVLFFPFVTNRSNFETAVVISNTTDDNLGTAYQSGRCTLRYHGAVNEEGLQPASQSTVVLNPGEQLVFTLSNGNSLQGVDPLPDFQGYLVTDCEFQHAQGFAFVTEQVGGTAILAQGYLAEVLRGSRRAGQASSR